MRNYIIWFFSIILIPIPHFVPNLIKFNDNEGVFGLAKVPREKSLSRNTMDEVATPVVDNMVSRVKDNYGKGQYGASRDKATRTHKGLDVITTVDEKVYAPIDGDIVREAVPYPMDPFYRGVLLKGTGNWTGYEVKIFYLQGNLSGSVKKGQQIGYAQDLKLKYPTITNHIHIEVKRFGVQLDPFELWQMSF